MSELPLHDYNFRTGFIRVHKVLFEAAPLQSLKKSSA